MSGRVVRTAAVDVAAAELRAGNLVAFPTETVFGLGADACNDRAVALIYQAKGRPSFNPLIVHVSGVEHAERAVLFNARARKLAQRFWPGPLTLVCKCRADTPVSVITRAGLDTIGVRCPDQPVARALIESSGCFVAAPSANASGKLSPTTADHVVRSLTANIERQGLTLTVLEGDACRVGLESTIVDVSTEDGPVLVLRPGGVTPDEIAECLGVEVVELGEQTKVQAEAAKQVVAPGQLANHYAPTLPVRLNALDVAPDEAYVSFGDDAGVRGIAECAVRVSLSATGDLGEAASRLFGLFWDVDEAAARSERPVRGIAVAPIPNDGVGIAINDRLRRAAAPRPLEEP